MAVLKVNGAAVPAPSEMKIAVFDVGSGVSRSASGLAVFDRTGVKRRLELKWNHMDSAALCALLEACGSGFFHVEYPDPQLGGARGMDCCCGDRVTGILRMVNGAPLWKNVEMTWTER